MEELNDLLTYIDNNSSELKEGIYKNILDKMKNIHNKLELPTKKYIISFAMSNATISQNSMTDVCIYNNFHIDYEQFFMTEKDYTYLSSLLETKGSLDYFAIRDSKWLDLLMKYVVGLKSKNYVKLKNQGHNDDYFNAQTLYTVYNDVKIIKIEELEDEYSDDEDDNTIIDRGINVGNNRNNVNPITNIRRVYPNNLNR